MLSVRAGSNNAKADGVVHKVAEVIVHDQYNANTNANDIALIKVTPRLKVGSTIDIVKLPIDKEIVPPNLEALLTGYGKTSVSLIVDSKFSYRLITHQLFSGFRYSHLCVTKCGNANKSRKCLQSIHWLNKYQYVS